MYPFEDLNTQGLHRDNKVFDFSDNRSKLMDNLD